jgi:hypothetical protein
VDSAGKVLGLASLLCGRPRAYLRFFVLLGQVMSYGAAHLAEYFFLFRTARGLGATAALRLPPP